MTGSVNYAQFNMHTKWVYQSKWVVSENNSGLCSVGYIFLYTRVTTRPLPVLDMFCDSCKIFIPLPDSSVISVETSYRYPGMGYAFHTRTWRSSVTSAQHYNLPVKFCDFCTTFIPLSDSSVTSVTNLIPYRKYPYPTEHNLFLSVQLPHVPSPTVCLVYVFF